MKVGGAMMHGMRSACGNQHVEVIIMGNLFVNM
jgi:hypothetical protein